VFVVLPPLSRDCSARDVHSSSHDRSPDLRIDQPLQNKLRLPLSSFPPTLSTMPWPAKPPMTLKEAKRAYKKDSSGFKFTPSQLARADRQDEQEEKRRKALEKEKTRQDNKRKREDKAEKDRAVKRKMLDEGRITVEDTWGKVTASQPRLNKFFAQPPAETGPPSRLRHELTSKSDDDAQENLLDGLESEDEDNKKPGIVETKNDATPAREIGSPDVSSSPKAPVQLIQDPRSTNTKNPPGLSKTLHKLPSPLQELHSSRINATAGYIHRRSSDLKARTHYVSTKVDDLENSIVVKEPAAKLLKHKPAPLPTAEISRVALPAPARQSDQTRVLRSADNPLSVSSTDRHSDEPRRAVSNSRSDGNNQGAEEDFTDGMDDNAFLELWDRQNDNGGDHYSSASLPDGSDSKPSPVLTSNDDTINTVELLPRDWQTEKQERSTFPKEDSTTDALPTILNESFSAVFNEIDDSELIAFAEQVEASMVASPQVCSIPTKAVANSLPAVSKTSKIQSTPRTRYPLGLEKSNTTCTDTNVSTFTPHVPPNTEKSLGTSGGVPADRNNPSTSTITTTSSSLLVPAEVEPPQARSKRRRAMPWDDIEGPGPSTQAAMLELLEQAEAQMKR
jgi:hypothetical protein